MSKVVQNRNSLLVVAKADRVGGMNENSQNMTTKLSGLDLRATEQQDLQQTTNEEGEVSMKIPQSPLGTGTGSRNQKSNQTTNKLTPSSRQGPISRKSSTRNSLGAHYK